MSNEVEIGVAIQLIIEQNEVARLTMLPFCSLQVMRNIAVSLLLSPILSLETIGSYYSQY